MVEQTQVAQSKRIQRRTGKTFHVATRLLPKRIRHATYVLYGFFRIADEVVDAEETAPPAEQRAKLERLRRGALGEEPTDEPVLDAFAAVRAEHGIADEDVHSFVDAMESDIDTDRYETYDELETYMDGSAAAVGRMMTAIMDLDDARRGLPDDELPPRRPGGRRRARPHLPPLGDPPAARRELATDPRSGVRLERRGRDARGARPDRAALRGGRRGDQV